MQSVPEHRAAVHVCIGRMNEGANAPPFVDLPPQPPQSRRVAVREEKTASTAAVSLVFIAKSLLIAFRIRIPCPNAPSEVYDVEAAQTHVAAAHRESIGAAVSRQPIRTILSTQ